MRCFNSVILEADVKSVSAVMVVMVMAMAMHVLLSDVVVELCW